MTNTEYLNKIISYHNIKQIDIVNEMNKISEKKTKIFQSGLSRILKQPNTNNLTLLTSVSNLSGVPLETIIKEEPFTERPPEKSSNNYDLLLLTKRVETLEIQIKRVNESLGIK